VRPRLWLFLLACTLLAAGAPREADCAAQPPRAAASATPAPPPGSEATPFPAQGPATGQATTPVPAPSPAPVVDLEAPLDSGERDTLQRLAWQTLVGHLTSRPIEDRDLESYDLTPRLTTPRGCFVTLKKGGQVRGNQGDIEPSRPLYQQVMVFTRRAATRDPRFLPLTDRDIDDLVVEIAVIGRREPVTGPAAIQLDRHGVFLEKWGRRALFLPGQAASQGWTAERTLDELCRQAALPAGAWRQAARLEVFTADVIAGPRPPPPAAATEPTAAPGVNAPAPALKPDP